MAIVLVPIPITDTMLQPGTVPAVDVDAGEVAWVSGQTVTVGNERVYNRRIWKCAVVPVNPAVSPDNDPIAWSDMRPSNRSAPFDAQVQTRAVGRKGSAKYIIATKFVSGLEVRNFAGQRLKITVKDATTNEDLTPAVDRTLKTSRPSFWNYLFGTKTLISSHRIEGIEMRPRVVVMIEVTGDVAEEVGIGYISIGSWVTLGLMDGKPGTLYGARAEAVNYTFREEAPDGSYRQLPRGSATNLTLPVAINPNDANRVWSSIQQLKDTPVSIYASKLEKYRYLSTVGFVTTDLSPENSVITKANIFVKGVV